MRKGKTGHKQITGSLINHKGTGCCALGAAGIGAKLWYNGNSCYRKLNLQDTPYILIATKFPILNIVAEHPVRDYKDKMQDIITSLNDTYKWSITKIANWVRSQEKMRGM